MGSLEQESPMTSLPHSSATRPDSSTETATLPPSIPDALPVLVLEGDPSVAEFLGDYLSEHGMHPLVCLGPAQASHALRRLPSLRVALIDINHFPLGGFAAADDLLAVQPNIQIIYLSSMNSGQSGEWQRALSQGAHDIIAKPLCGSRLLSAIGRAMTAATEISGPCPKQRVERVEALIAQIDHDGVYNNAALSPLMACIKDHDPQGPLHCERVGAVVQWLAAQAGMAPQWCTLVASAAALHDLGMIAIHTDIKTPYDSLGYKAACNRTHAALGHGLLAACRHPTLSLAAEIALAHHEQWNGGGYPLGLHGEDIPLSARLTSIADAYDHLRNGHHLNHRQAVQTLLRGGTEHRPDHFEPRLLALLTPDDDPFAARYAG
jgi:putative two-component system response regulator